MNQDDQLREHIMAFEGMESQPYEDTKDYTTVGMGANLDAPGTEQHLKAMGLDSNLEKISDEQAQELYERQMAEKRNIFNNIRQQNFPQAQLAPNQENALMAMIYQNLGYLGPNMRGHLKAGDDAAVFKEMLLRSNKGDDPGIQRRRLAEAKMYAGDQYDELLQSLTPEEITEIRQIISNMKNPHTKMQTFEEYPFLKEIAPQSPKFDKIARRFK